ncbi:hypothetical protein, partial [Reyranella soli]|uniref:hypothetical protein n=1 Tax=Reyranella soli TaxID=1230389 RepID=UPI001C3F778E
SWNSPRIDHPPRDTRLANHHSQIRGNFFSKLLDEIHDRGGSQEDDTDNKADDYYSLLGVIEARSKDFPSYMVRSPFGQGVWVCRGNRLNNEAREGGLEVHDVRLFSAGCVSRGVN